MLESIHPENFHYHLPEERIAKFPLENRTDSKLLIYKPGRIIDSQFKHLTDFLPKKSHIVFNNTRVIPARIILYKESGARIEVFLLEPVAPSVLVEKAMISKNECVWSCLIGNSKKWKTGTILTKELNPNIVLEITKSDDHQVKFRWNGEMTFAEIIKLCGQVPLPPYLHREPIEIDIPRYQTIFGNQEGAVAAPTAALHFDEYLINEIQNKFLSSQVTLHVSAGTFQPITTSAYDHNMHTEQVIIQKESIEYIIKNPNIIAVGTTSMRTLESLYWYGVRILYGIDQFDISKDFPYRMNQSPDVVSSLQAVIHDMEKKGLESLSGHTRLMIVPGYTFKIVKGLITNFHLPSTTLMMLVAAFVGEDWKKIYNHALNYNYRFLSYGDSSLLLPNN